ncbi:unnamed protein product [Closterium sp. NIES-64]|nr:unnamed protein product [Closterium sp. NIES-64]
MDCHELRWQQMDSRREFSPSRRMRSLERGRSRTRSPRRTAYRADGGSPIRGRRGGSQGDPHAKAEPRPRPSGTDPGNLAGGQQGAGEGRHDDADMTDSPESARKADDEGDCEGVTTARGGGEQRLGREEADLQNRGAEERNSDAEKDPALEGMCEEGRVRCRGNTAADCSPDDRRKGSARRRESADAAGATDETDGSGERLHGSGDAAGATDENEMGGNGARRRGEEQADAKEDDLQSDGRDGRETRGCVMEEDRSANEMRGGGARHHEDMAADRAREEMREGSARRRGSMNADRSAGEMRGGARRRGGADAAGLTDGMRGNDTRRCGSTDADSSAGEMPENGARRRGSTDADSSAGEMPENGARRRGSADADRSPGRLRGSNARRSEGKETERTPGASREEERRRDVQAGVYSSPEPRRGHERRRRMALGGWRSPEQGGEGSEHAHERRRARRSRARQRTGEREARVNGSVCWWQYITGADARTHRNGVDEYPCAGAGLVQDPVGEARGRQEREINMRRGEEERCWREVSPGKDPGSDKGRGREDHERRGAGGQGRRCEGESLERKEWREKMRRSDEELREEKEHEYSEEEDYGYDLERRRRGKPEWREKKSCPEEREGYRGRREGRMEPGAGVREKQDLSGQRKRGDKQHMRREGMHEYDTESGEEEESDWRARHGSRQKEESWEEYFPRRREGLRSRQEERREFREREDRQQRERRKREGRFQDYSPERRERRWGEAGGRREAHEEEQRRSPSPRGPRRPRQTGEGSSEARAAREGIDRVLDGRRKQVSKVGAWVCVQVTPETEEKDKKVGAWADEPVAVGTEGKDEKVGAWAAAEGEEKDEKEGAGACELVAAGAEEKDEQVGAWECAPAAAEAEEKDEQVGAWVCAPAAAEAEEKDEQVGAGACVTAAAEAEEKDEKVGAGVCVTAAAKAEEKEEQVGAGVCVPAVAEAERKDEKVGARPCVLKAEKQVQGSMRAEQHVRKLREERPELLGEKMVKEAVRGAETGVRSIKVGMACDWGTGDLRVGGWEGPVWDKAQEQEEAERESKEVGAWECLPVGEERQHTMENATSQEAEEAVKTVRWIKGGTWADEPMRLASQVLSESRGMEEAEKWAAWEGGKAVGHLKEVILALVEDLHVVQMGDACSYEHRQQLGGRGTEEAHVLETFPRERRAEQGEGRGIDVGMAGGTAPTSRDGLLPVGVHVAC